MRVADLMQTDVKAITPDASIDELVRSLAEARVSGLPVVNTDGHVIGVVSAGDVLRAAAALDAAAGRLRDVAPRLHVVLAPPRGQNLDDPW